MVYVLGMCKQTKAAKGSDLGVRLPDRERKFLASEVVQILATTVRIGARDVGPEYEGDDDAGGFGVDSAISRSRNILDLVGASAAAWHGIVSLRRISD